jgi:putative hydrolase of the HAD superfamily
MYADIRAVAFDVNGTLTEIVTDEGMDEIFRAAGHFLTYQGIDLRRHELRDFYLGILKSQQQDSAEEHPEFDAVAIWRTIISEYQTDYTRRLPAEKLAQLPLFLAELYRGVSRRRLRLYPHARRVLDVLRTRFPLAVVTDGQSAYARAELHQVGLLGYFDPIIVSGDHGYRKPDRRLFQAAAAGMQIAPEHVLYVGNDMYRDIYGAREAGMATVLFDSDQGTKEYPGCVPDHTLTDHRRLLTILGLDLPPVTSPRPSALPADTAVVADVVASQGGRAAGTGACDLPERRTCR